MDKKYEVFVMNSVGTFLQKMVKTSLQKYFFLAFLGRRQKWSTEEAVLLKRKHYLLLIILLVVTKS
jgi:hypothetical protein